MAITRKVKCLRNASHVITVNELDPLRDEGLEYYRMLMKATVKARAVTLNGTVHAAEGIFVKYVSELFELLSMTL